MTDSQKKQCEPACHNCIYWDDFSSVCFNADSPMCEDFTDGDSVCLEFKEDN